MGRQHGGRTSAISFVAPKADTESAQTKAPSTNIQPPEKHQAPSTNRFARCDCCFKLGASLVLGAWNLDVSFLFINLWRSGSRGCEHSNRPSDCCEIRNA